MERVSYFYFFYFWRSIIYLDSSIGPTLFRIGSKLFFLEKKNIMCLIKHICHSIQPILSCVGVRLPLLIDAAHRQTTAGLMVTGLGVGSLRCDGRCRRWALLSMYTGFVVARTSSANFSSVQKALHSVIYVCVVIISICCHWRPGNYSTNPILSGHLSHVPHELDHTEQQADRTADSQHKKHTTHVGQAQALLVTL